MSHCSRAGDEQRLQDVQMAGGRGKVQRRVAVCSRLILRTWCRVSACRSSAIQREVRFHGSKTHHGVGVRREASLDCIEIPRPRCLMQRWISSRRGSAVCALLYCAISVGHDSS